MEHFHANDCNGYIPGSGSANYREIVQGLLEINYSGYYPSKSSTSSQARKP
ncbi:hypothetical protein [Thermofilum sp.]|uniref:hypothetical protein n=1 Tax=Thermofilum sp. TaxID=1961369 RepID=UPI00316342A2